MRPFHRVSLIILLAGGMIVAAIGLERYYVTPLVEQSRLRSEPSEAGDELPPECLKELASMESSTAEASSARGNQLDERVARNPAPPEPSSRQEGPMLAGDSIAARPIAATMRGEPPISTSRVSASEPRELPARLVTMFIAVVEEPSPQAARDLLPAADLMDLMRRLRSDDADERAQARSELRRRGFGEVDLELARQLFSPDAEARKQLARTVPRLESVDASRWLMWLVLDPDPEVRMAAITTLATTGDPGLLDRVEAIAAKDGDARIQSLAQQIAKQRDMAAARGEPTQRTGSAANPLR